MNAITQGLGDVLTSAPVFSNVTGSSGHGSCSATYWNANPLALLDPACYGPSSLLPKAPAPTTTLVANGGTDVAGNPTYDVVTQSPQDNQAAYAQQIQQFLDGLNTPDPPDPPASTSTNWTVIAIVAGVVLVMFLGGQHR